MKRILIIVLVLFPVLSFSQKLSVEETELYNLIMKYREEMGLKKIPLSPSLTIVAQTHVKDLVDNMPDLGECNGHSWSDKGTWTACCYTPDHAKSECMWNKPGELTTYKGYGFEIATGSNDCCSDFVMTAEYALQSWQGSAGHDAVIVNSGKWEQAWNAVGIGLYGGFAVVWFGWDADPLPE